MEKKSLGAYEIDVDEQNRVPYYSMEWMFAREERHMRRLIVLLAITIIMLFASNALWLYAWMQYDYGGQEITATQDGEGVNIVGGEDVQYGSESSDTQTMEEEKEREVTRNAEEEK